MARAVKLYLIALGAIFLAGGIALGIHALTPSKGPVRGVIERVETVDLSFRKPWRFSTYVKLKNDPRYYRIPTYMLSSPSPRMLRGARRAEFLYDPQAYVLRGIKNTRPMPEATRGKDGRIHVDYALSPAPMSHGVHAVTLDGTVHMSQQEYRSEGLAQALILAGAGVFAIVFALKAGNNRSISRD